MLLILGIITVLMLFIGIGVGFMALFDGSKDLAMKMFLIGLGGLILLFITNCFVIINPGEVGVVNIFGTVNDQPLQAGIHIVTPFITGIIPFDVKTQVDTYQAQVLTAEGLSCACDMSLNYRIDPSKVPEIYKTIGLGYKDVIIDPEVRSAIRDVIATYDAKSIYSGDRTNISSKIQRAIETPLLERGIIVETVLLRSTTLPQKVTDAIEAKQQMEQQIQQKAFEVQKEQMEAQRKVAEAQGIADANKIISNSITPAYVDWYTITMMEKRSGDTYFIPVGNNGLPLVGNVPMTSTVASTAQ